MFHGHTGRTCCCYRRFQLKWVFVQLQWSDGHVVRKVWEQSTTWQWGSPLFVLERVQSGLILPRASSAPSKTCLACESSPKWIMSLHGLPVAPLHPLVVSCDDCALATLRVGKPRILKSTCPVKCALRLEGGVEASGATTRTLSIPSPISSDLNWKPPPWQLSARS